MAYWPAFFGQKIWDDHFLVGKNPFFRSPTVAFECFRHWLYPFDVTSYFRPVQNLSYISDYWFWGESLFGYHATNVLVHTGAALLLAILVRTVANRFTPERRLRNAVLGIGSGVVWLVHPIHHAAVAYISGRADSLAALFCLTAWLLVEKGLTTPEIRARMAWYFLAAIACFVGLFSKEIAITWIVLFCIYQAFFNSAGAKLDRRILVVGAAAIVSAYFMYRQSLPRVGEVAATLPTSSILGSANQAVRALGDYVSITVFPFNLHMERQLCAPSEELRMSAPWLHYHALTLIPLGISALAAFALLCFRKCEDRQLNIFATSWFFVGFLPISNLIPLNAPVAEHWIYMPSAALVLLIVKGFLAVPLGSPSLRVAGLAVVTVVFTTLTHSQSRIWVNEETMFRTFIERGGDTARARANLGRVLVAKGDFVAAEEVIRGALHQHPNHPALTLQLASILKAQRKTEESLEINSRIETVLKGKDLRPPKPWSPEVHRVQLLLSEKKYEEAKALIAEALLRWPHTWDLTQLQVIAHGALEEPDQAVSTLTEYVQVNWWHREAVVSLAQHYSQLKQYDNAVSKYELAGLLDVRDAKPWEQIAAIRVHQGRPAEALVAQKNAVRAEPKSSEPRFKLAQLHHLLGEQVDEVIERHTAERLLEQERSEAAKPGQSQ